ncbi:uncharacterized protein [Pyrus communis]|uniref:uncharacterized protein n=1 Tax=Pyrus communis TaxID=23211 RepID=UPI0035BEEAEA
MLGMDPFMVYHFLHLDPISRPVIQRKQKHGIERNKIIKVEIAKLKDAQFIVEVHNPNWPAKVVLVQKEEWKVESMRGFDRLEQSLPKGSIPNSTDRPIGRLNRGTRTLKLYECLRIKNAWTTHQRLVNRIFKEKIRDTMKVYMDDMVVKSEKKKDHITHLQDSFDLLQKYNIKLNREKRTFKVASCKFLGYMVTKCGIEATDQGHHRDEIAQNHEGNIKPNRASNSPQQILFTIHR